jgi:hypothetical protein
MPVATQTSTQPVLLVREMRWVLLAASVLVVIVGLTLFIFSGSTARLFAWTVNPPITAAFMGSAFLAASALEFLSARETYWANARAGVPAVLVFTTVTLVVTLYHIDKFHTGQFDGIVWIVVYIAFPPLMLLALIKQLRQPGGDTPRLYPLPNWLRLISAIQAAILIITGILLLAIPLTVAHHWPWALTALTGRAIGAWLVGLGLAAGQSALENDHRRVRSVAISSIILPVLVFVAILRYQDQIDWSLLTSWVFVIVLASILLVGVYEIASSRSSTASMAPA